MYAIGEVTAGRRPWRKPVILTAELSDNFDVAHEMAPLYGLVRFFQLLTFHRI